MLQLMTPVLFNGRSATIRGRRTTPIFLEQRYDVRYDDWHGKGEIERFVHDIPRDRLVVTGEPAIHFDEHGRPVAPKKKADSGE